MNKNERDKLLRNVWLSLRDLSDEVGAEMSNEDLNVWTAVTQHSAIQSWLGIVQSPTPNAVKENK